MKAKTFAVAVAALSAFLSSATAPRAQSRSASSAAPRGAALTVPAGEKLVLQLETPLHTRRTKAGERAQFRTATDVMAGNEIAIPRGTPVEATVTKVSRPGMLAGRAEIQLHFNDA